MATILDDFIPYSSIYVALFVCGVGCVLLHLDSLRGHRARTASRNVSSYSWRH